MTQDLVILALEVWLLQRQDTLNEIKVLTSKIEEAKLLVLKLDELIKDAKGILE